MTDQAPPPGPGISHHRIASACLAIGVFLIAVYGQAFATYEHLPFWHGAYCALANAATDGCDRAPTTHAGYLIAALEFVTVVPLFGAAITFFTSGLLAGHVRRHVTAAVTDAMTSTAVTDAITTAAAQPGQPDC